MKPFTFRLDRILNYRDYMVKKAQRDLFHAQDEVNSTERTIENLVSMRKNTARECLDRGARGMEVARYLIHRHFLQGLDRHLERAHLNLKRCEKKVVEKKKGLQKASVGKKSLEVLREIELENYKREMEAEEQKILDELVLLRRGDNP